jgi:hypothetical protein
MSQFTQTPTVQPVQPNIQIFPQAATPPQSYMTTPNKNGNAGYFNMQKFHQFRGVIIFTFFIVMVSLGFLLYLAVTDTEFRNTPTPANNTTNYQTINLIALVFGSASVLLMIVVVSLTAMKRYTGNPQYKQVGSDQPVQQYGAPPTYQQPQVYQSTPAYTTYPNQPYTQQSMFNPQSPSTSTSATKVPYTTNKD